MRLDDWHSRLDHLLQEAIATNEALQRAIAGGAALRVTDALYLRHAILDRQIQSHCERGEQLRAAIVLSN